MSERLESAARVIAYVMGYKFEKLPETSWFFGWNESKEKMRKRAGEFISIAYPDEAEKIEAVFVSDNPNKITATF